MSPVARFLVVLAAGFVSAASLGKLVPHLDWMARHFDVSLAAAGFAVSCVMLPGAAAGWTFGALADRFGAKTVAVGGLLLAGAASIGAGVTESFAILVAIRIVEGIGYTLLVVAATVLIAGHGALALSVWSSFAPIGFALGQWAASYSGSDGDSPLVAIGFLHAVALGLAAVAVHLVVKDVPPRRTASEASALRHPPALLSAAAFGGVCAVLLAAVALAPVVLAAATGRTVAEIASLTAIAALPSIVGRIAPGWLLQRGAKPLTVFLAASLVAALCLIGALALPLWPALVLFALFQISAGALPGLLSAMMPHVAPTPAQLGTVSGMCSQAVNMGNLVGPPAILAVYAAAGTTAAVAVMVVVLAASLAAIAGLPIFRKDLRQTA